MTSAGDAESASRFSDAADRIAPLVVKLHKEHPLEEVPYNLISPTMFYRTVARQAACGDVEGAVRRVREAAKRMLSCQSGTLAENMSDSGDMRPVDDPEAEYGIGSLCHGWNAQIVEFIATHIAGIKQLSPGWTAVSIRPNPCGLTHFRCVRSTPLGPIEVRYDNGKTDVVLPDEMRLVNE